MSESSPSSSSSLSTRNLIVEPIFSLEERPFASFDDNNIINKRTDFVLLNTRYNNNFRNRRSVRSPINTTTVETESLSTSSLTCSSSSHWTQFQLDDEKKGDRFLRSRCTSSNDFDNEQIDIESTSSFACFNNNPQSLSRETRQRKTAFLVATTCTVTTFTVTPTTTAWVSGDKKTPAQAPSLDKIIIVESNELASRVALEEEEEEEEDEDSFVILRERPTPSSNQRPFGADHSSSSIDPGLMKNSSAFDGHFRILRLSPIQ